MAAPVSGCALCGSLHGIAWARILFPGTHRFFRRVWPVIDAFAHQPERAGHHLRDYFLPPRIDATAAVLLLQFRGSDLGTGGGHLVF